ncbi:MAG: hypothetical protein WKF73_16080 [Nocardioidaceae bacterium]
MMRCLAVGETARRAGWGVCMSADLSALPWVRPWLSDLGVDVVDAVNSDALVALALETGADVILLDCYDFDDMRRPASDAGVLLANFEDGAFGQRDADVGIDYALGAEHSAPAGMSGRVELRGIAYAPIRYEIRAARAEHRPTAYAGATGRVLVLMGGTDAHGLGSGLAALLSSAGVAALSPPPGLALVNALRTVDAVVSAAGVSAYELCCLGMPIGLVQVAPNQQANYDRLTDSGAATGLGSADRIRSDPTGLSADVLGWLETPDRLAQTAARAWELVDGFGADRILAALGQLSR